MRKDYSQEIGMLISTICQPAIAGGLSEEEAKEIYDTIMSRIASLGNDTMGISAFQRLFEEIAEKVCPHFDKIHKSTSN